jgi:hypothetical protein
MGADHDAAVKRGVQPLVRVGRPRVRPFDTGEYGPDLGTGDRPESDGPVHVDPCLTAMRDLANYVQGIDATGVNVARLHTDDRRADNRVKRIGQCIRVDDSVGATTDCSQGIGADPQQPQCSVDAGMPLFCREYGNRRRAPQTLCLHVPAGPSQQVMTCGRQGGKGRHLTAGDEADRAVRGKPEQLANPVRHHLLGHRRDRARHVRCGVLVPGANEPVRTDRSRHRGTHHEPEEPRSGAGHRADLTRSSDQRYDIRWILGLVRHPSSEQFPQLGRTRRRCHRSLADLGQELACMLNRGVEHSIPRLGRRRYLVRHRYLHLMIQCWPHIGRRSSVRRDLLG